MPLRIGDEIWFDGALGRVVAVADTTDPQGRGTIEYGGQTFRFRVLKAIGPDVPLVATEDEYLRVGLVQRDGVAAEAAPTFVLAFDDLPAPVGWGRRIQQDRWREAGELTGEDSVVFVLGWRPGKLTVKRGGGAQAGVHVDMVLRYDTDQGVHEAWWQPAYPYNGLSGDPPGRDIGILKGRFKTNAQAEVKSCAPSGTLSDIIVPRGMGALGHRLQDMWAGAPVSERTLTQLRLYYKQEWVEVAEGADATLDVAAVSLAIAGPANATAKAMLYGGAPYGTPTPFDEGVSLGAGGSVTLTGLPPGEYHVQLYHPTDMDKGLSAQTVDCEQPGGSYTIAFGSSWTTVTDMQIAGRLYAYGAVGLGGATIWQYVDDPETPFTGWLALTTTDEDGGFGPVDPLPYGSDLAVDDPTYGSCACGGPLTSLWWDARLGGRIVCTPAGNFDPDRYEGVYPWGIAGRHENLPPVGGRILYAKNKQTGEEYAFETAPNGMAVMSEVMPRWRFGPDFTPPDDDYAYDLFDADGTDLGVDVGLMDDIGPPWVPAVNPQFWTCNTQGWWAEVIVGGKYQGNVVEADRSRRIGAGHLPEAARMGLEFGRWAQPLEARSMSEQVAAEAAPATALTFQAWECPYCGGPVWTDPDYGPYRRGYCVQCTDYGLTTDCRTYFITRTLAAADDWQTQWVKNTTAGGYVDRLVAGWPRPEEYEQTTSYLEAGGSETSGPASRWFARHIVLGTWLNDTFVDGESIADAETRLGRTVGPVMLKLELTADYEGAGQTLRITCVRVDGRTEYRDVAVPPGSRAGDLLPLHWRPHHYYPQGYYVDVTGIERLAGDGALYARVVNDGPAWHSTAGVAVAHHQQQPYACDVALGSRDPFLIEDFGGRLHLVYIREGYLLHRTLEGSSASWSPAANVTLRAGWPHPSREPSLAPLPHAELLVAAHTKGKTRLWRSRDDGGRWG